MYKNITPIIKKLNRKPRFGSKLIKHHPLAKGLVGAWLMNEGAGNLVNDLSGHNLNGEIIGATWKSSPKGIVLDFTGGNTDKVNCGVPVGFGGKNGMSAIVIAKATFNDNGGLFGQRDDVGTAGWQMWQYSNKLFCRVINNSGTNQAASGGVTLTTGEWYTYALRWKSGESVQTFLNGVFDSQSSTLTGTTREATSQIQIGWSLGDEYHTETQIALALLYNRALTAQEIQQICTNQYAIFDESSIWALDTDEPPGLNIPTAMYHYMHH